MPTYYAKEYPGGEVILEFIEEHPKGKFTYQAKDSFRPSDCDVAKIECRLLATSKKVDPNFEKFPRKVFFHKKAWTQGLKQIKVEDFPLYISYQCSSEFEKILRGINT